jgi:hypothetical protein
MAGYPMAGMGDQQDRFCVVTDENEAFGPFSSIAGARAWISDKGFKATTVTRVLTFKDPEAEPFMLTFTPEEAMGILIAEFPHDDSEDLETYVYGPDEPENYFAKMAGPQEIISDYEEFRKGLEPMGSTEVPASMESDWRNLPLVDLGEIRVEVAPHLKTRFITAEDVRVEAAATMPLPGAGVDNSGYVRGIEVEKHLAKARICLQGDVDEQIYLGQLSYLRSQAMKIAELCTAMMASPTQRTTRYDG